MEASIYNLTGTSVSLSLSVGSLSLIHIYSTIVTIIVFHCYIITLGYRYYLHRSASMGAKSKGNFQEGNGSKLQISKLTLITALYLL